MPSLDTVLQQAVRRIAPLWPLEHFVAVNPYIGLTDHSFEQAARRMARVAGARATLPRSFHADAIRSGRIGERHLREALEQERAGAAADPSRHDLLPHDVEGLKQLVFASLECDVSTSEVLPTVTDAVGRLVGADWTTFATERISAWAASYFDGDQASWGTPWASQTPWAAWKNEARHDRTPELHGWTEFRSFVAALPDDPRTAVASFVERLEVPESGLELYFHRLLMTVGGWASWMRYRLWEAELHGGTDDGMVELLAIRLAHEVALLEVFAARGSDAAWAQAREQYRAELDLSAPVEALQIDLVLQNAFEMAWQDRFVARFPIPSDAPELVAGASSGREAAERPDLQAAFCIDVRSEVFRRALEATSKKIETIGFAGFFGFSLDFVQVGREARGARCPALLTPAATILETVDPAPGDPAADEQASLARARTLRARAKAVWMSFKMGAVSCFGFVGPVGLAYAGKLLTDGFGWTRPVPHPDHAGLGWGEVERLGPSLEVADVGGTITGLTAQQRLETAEGVLRAMGLTEGLAPVVLLAGHGSSTVNNPHATGLDCGACGGHTGEANARVAADVLNDPQVRAGLVGRGIAIPRDTWFIAALHDTTTDEVKLFPPRRTTPDLDARLGQVRRDLRAAGARARVERAAALKVDPGRADAGVTARSRDWAQVRPEWGLAGCSAFVAAPRSRTAGLDLSGRSFLHDYDWQADEGFGVLELIMTAPMVVASWINLQYYGSTVDNRVFGGGNKVLHNVVGALGVLEGNGGDLRPGLPWQSVHDGERYVHEPLRLNVVIEAPREAMNDVIARHPDVQALLDNGWVHLWAMDEAGAITWRYDGELAWRRASHPAEGEEVSEQAA